MIARQIILEELLVLSHDLGREERGLAILGEGNITLGATAKSVLAAMLMAEKAARIFLGSFALGGLRFLTPDQVIRISGRLDEHYRQRALGLK